MRAIKDSQPGYLWSMDVSQEARGTLRKLWLSQEAVRVKESSSSKVQIVIHCHPHSSAEAPAAGQLLGGKEIVPEFHRKYLNSFF